MNFNVFYFEIISQENVLLAINDLKHIYSSGFDNISKKTVKYIKQVLTPLILIINQALANGIFPDNMKKLPRLKHKQILNYFINNNVLTERQYGFRRKHSTEHGVLHHIQ